MLEIKIPGHGILNLSHLILDYNGTISCDGHLLQGVKERLADLSTSLDLHTIPGEEFHELYQNAQLFGQMAGGFEKIRKSTRGPLWEPWKAS